MTDHDELLQSILDSDSGADYPAGFLEKYVLMECLFPLSFALPYITREEYDSGNTGKGGE